MEKLRQMHGEKLTQKVLLLHLSQKNLQFFSAENQFWRFEEVVGNLIVLFGAGTDTTSVAGSLAFLDFFGMLQKSMANLFIPLFEWNSGRYSKALSWAFYHLARDQALQQRVAEEVKDLPEEVSMQHLASWMRWVIMSCELRIFILWQYECFIKVIMNIQTECSSNFIPHEAFADLWYGWFMAFPRTLCCR